MCYLSIRDAGGFPKLVLELVVYLLVGDLSISICGFGFSYFLYSLLMYELRFQILSLCTCTSMNILFNQYGVVCAMWMWVW